MCVFLTKLIIRSYEVPQIIKASIHPSKGRIQPLKMQTFLLTVIAGSRPSKITICLSCKFINVSERRLYEKELLSSFYTLKQLENYFTITEKGIFYPVYIEKLLFKHQTFFNYIK